ncbi:uncharacterized protein LOC141705990 [Apium graveolens]|uniref:uncharacterized protein LOC141705990 n=1 Tax=Apium graveolens TaxID=4045 RepID=UPI003D792891
MVENDMILFSFDVNGGLYGRIFMCEGIEITRSTEESSERSLPSGKFFLFEDTGPNPVAKMEQNVEIVDVASDMEVEGNDNSAEANVGIPDMELIENHNPYDAQNGMIL